MRAPATSGQPGHSGHPGHPSRPALPFVALAFVVLMFSFGPPLSKHISVTGQLTAFLRMAIGAAFMFALLRVQGTRPTLANLRRTALPGLAFAGNFGFLLPALHHASVATVAVIIAMQPVVVMVVAGPLFGERVTRWQVLWTVGGLLGAVLVVLGSDSAIRLEPIGLVYAVLSLLSWTAFFLLSKQRVTAIGPLEYMAGSTVWAAVCLLPFALLAASPADVGRIGAGNWLGILAIVFIPGVAHVTLGWCHEYVPVTVSSLAMLAQPPLAALVAWPLEHEPITLVQAIGGAVVLGSIAAVVRRRGERPAPVAAAASDVVPA